MPRVYLTQGGSVGFSYDPGDGPKRRGAVARRIVVTSEGVDLTDDEAKQALLRDPAIKQVEVEEEVGVGVEDSEDLTVAELKDAIHFMSFDELNTALAEELTNKNRSTAIDALESAIASRTED